MSLTIHGYICVRAPLQLSHRGVLGQGGVANELRITIYHGVIALGFAPLR
jgi:hypothetical protein